MPHEVLFLREGSGKDRASHRARAGIPTSGAGASATRARSAPSARRSISSRTRTANTSSSPTMPCRRRQNRSARRRSGSTRPCWSCSRSSTWGRSSPRPRRCGCWRKAGSRRDSSSTSMFRGIGARSCDEDKRLNDQALVDGSRLLSAYRTLKGERIWIITEAVGDDGKRSASTLLLPSQY